ncbi:hypothetical protein U9M48_026126 [Paspalum notatum var. saurae]|uniref:Exocyst subunit Exo70 family protein n=1 Tax=Paspalum notatum var. saurae TaxID=547442 RepID=A0AAQ3TRP3_PASNO
MGSSINMEDRFGARGLWSPITVRSSSGTIAGSGSTYTTSAAASLSMSMEALAAMLSLDSLEYIDKEKEREKEDDEKMKQMVQEFFGAPSADDCSTSVLQRWFTELGVPWVLHLAAAASAHDGAVAGTKLVELIPEIRSWIRALAAICETTLVMAPLFRPDCGSVGLLPRICKEEGSNIPDQSHFAQFIQSTMFKMLAFVDAIVASNAKNTYVQVFLTDSPGLYQKITALLGVRSALSRAIVNVGMSFNPRPSAEVERIQGEILSHLSASEGNLGEAIWSAMEQIRTELINTSSNDSLSSTSQGSSSDIHEATWSVLRYIRFMMSHHSSMRAIASEAAARLGKEYVPWEGGVQLLESMIMETVSCVQGNLAKQSESFPDQGLRFLFLLNNSNIIRQHLRSSHHPSLKAYGTSFTDKIEGYIKRYIHVSWAPVLSCLLNPTPPSCFRRNYTPMSKFKSKFQKTYTAQKMWKVPDPALRTRLHKAIIEKIIPGYTKYLEDNNVTAPKFAPHDMEEMVQGLFEG